MSESLSARVSDIRFQSLTPEQLPDLVRIHAAAFPESALTRLGNDAVRCYYQWQFEGPHQAAYLGAWVDGVAAGFCIGGVFQGALSGFLARYRWRLGWRLLVQPWLWANAEVRAAVGLAVRRLLARVVPSPAAPTAPATENESRAPAFGILALAVLPEFRRHRLGSRLMQALEEEARRRGFREMILTVNPRNTPAVAFYDRLGWERVSAGNIWQGTMRKSLANLGEVKE